MSLWCCKVKLSDDNRIMKLTVHAKYLKVEEFHKWDDAFQVNLGNIWNLYQDFKLPTGNAE